MTHFLDAFVEPALWFAADWSLRWAVLLAALALALWILRPRRAATRQLFLLTALTGGLLLPLAPRWGGGWQRTSNDITPPPQAKLPSEARPSPAKRRTQGTDVPRSGLLPRSLPSHEETTTAPPPAKVLNSRRIAVLGVGLGWVLAVAFLLLRWACGLWLLRRLRGEAVNGVGTEQELFSVCRREFGVRSAVRLAVHPRVQSPILLGLFRPLILVPSKWTELPSEARRAALLHELAHIRRRDHWLAPLLEMIRVVFFFHPLVRWLLARLEHERELLCDEMVVRRGIDRHAYARLLLDFARQSNRLTLPRLVVESYLPMGRRRTVKARIHHLLEEDMERWMGPLPARWAVVLGSALLALLLGLASYCVRAVETGKPDTAEKAAKPQSAAKKGEEKSPVPSKPAAQAKREALRYGGKDFQQWRRELVTELKPSIRIDGLKALAAFGANGYGAEATQAIAEMMRGYDVYNAPTGDDATIVQAARSALKKIGPAAVPGLLPGLKDDNRNARRFAIWALAAFQGDARTAVPALLQALQHGDAEMRACAIQTVEVIDSEAKEFVPALLGALKDEDENVRSNAASTLGNVGKEGKAVIPALVEALRDKKAAVRAAALGALQQLRAGARVVPAVSRLLEDDNSDVQNNAWGFLSQTKPAEMREAIPALIAVLKDKKSGHRTQAATLLGRIGPAAQEAIPALTQALSADDENLSSAANSALKTIGEK